MTQSLTEITLGSLLHSFHVPLSGHFLSLNQFAVLTWASRETHGRKDAVESCGSITAAAAILKALSPSGKRITPMLAISVQGLLFSLGVLAAGPTWMGVCSGAALASLWAFLQPALLAYFIFGDSLLAGIAKIWSEITLALDIPSSAGIWLISFVFILKAVASIVTASVAWKCAKGSESAYLDHLQSLAVRVLPKPKASAISPWKGALRDLLQPGFLFALFLSLAFYGLRARPDLVGAGMIFLRGLALGLLTFWALRAIPAERISGALHRFPKLRTTVSQALRELSRT